MRDQTEQAKYQGKGEPHAVGNVPVSKHMRQELAKAKKQGRAAAFQEREILKAAKR